MLNSFLIKQKFIIKQPEKPQRPGTVKPPVKRNSEVRSNKVHKLVNEKEKKKSDYEKSKQKKMTATVGSTKGKENVLAPKITPLCLSTLSSSIIKCKVFVVVFLLLKLILKLCLFGANLFISLSDISCREENSHAETCSCTSEPYV